MNRTTAADFDQELLDLYDEYVHGQVTRRTFLDRASKFAVGGLTAAALLEERGCVLQAPLYTLLRALLRALLHRRLVGHVDVPQHAPLQRRPPPKGRGRKHERKQVRHLAVGAKELQPRGGPGRPCGAGAGAGRGVERWSLGLSSRPRGGGVQQAPC